MKERNLYDDLQLCEDVFYDTGNCNVCLVTGDDYFSHMVDIVTDCGYESFAYTRCEPYAKFIAESRLGWEHAIKRAIAAEERVRELERQLKTIK